ncbi:MAG: agmatine deiminase family protein [Myxococcota bacterium]
MKQPWISSALLLPVLACAAPASTGSSLDGATAAPGEGSGEGSGGEGSSAGADDSTSGVGGDSGLDPTATRRVPAEWEPQAALWMQWPGEWERHFEETFVEVIAIARQHQPVHLVAANGSMRDRATNMLADAGVSSDGITWHIIPTDNAWMRDNGPRYVMVDDQMVVQDWGFDGWGGNFGADIPYEDDNRVPPVIADYLGLPVETVDMVHERGDLEFNGLDTVMVNWSVVTDRNPDLSEAQATAIFESAFGVSSVIYLEGFHPEDGTTGHVDGLARFISEDEVVVGQISNPDFDPVFADLFENVAGQIAAQRPDLTIIRMPFPADTDYMNWLVGNGYVISGAFGNAQADAAAQAQLQQWFPERTIYMVDVRDLWVDGGGIHCVTNDQPL